MERIKAEADALRQRVQALSAPVTDEEMESHGVLVEGKALRKWEADALIVARVRYSKSAPARADEASK